MTGNPQIPGGGGANVYSVDDPDLLAELQTPQLATLAPWQPKVNS